MNVLSIPPLSERLALILDGLCRAVAARVLGGGLEGALIVLIWGRVRRAEGRLLGLLARFRAGRVLVRVSPTLRVAGGVRGLGAVRLPRRFGWLLPLVPQHAAGFASQLRAVLDDAEMRALLAAVPQARRVLAPVCRMLGIEAEVLAVVEPGVVRAVRVRPEPGSDALPLAEVSGLGRPGFLKPG